MEEEITGGSRLLELNEHNSDNEMEDTVEFQCTWRVLCASLFNLYK